MNKPVAIYVCLDDEGLPRYVGKTTNPIDRRAAHRREKPWFCCLLILEWTSLERYQQSEKDWIAYFRHLGFPLENKNNGGGGLRFQSSEAKQHMREIMAGRKQAAEVIERRVAPLRGRKLSEEHVEKIRTGNTGKRHSEETKDKIRQNSKKQWERQKEEGYSPSEEHKAKISASISEHWKIRHGKAGR